LEPVGAKRVGTDVSEELSMEDDLVDGRFALRPTRMFH
jgi:hypothetical protein